MVESIDGCPSLRAIPFGPGIRDAARLLSPRQRSQLAGIATRVHFPARKLVYREGSNAQSVFIIANGVVKSFRDLPSGKRRVMAFLFPDDLFGIAQSGHYANSVQTITPVTLYRMRVTTLTDTLRRDADLAVQFLCKVTHELRGSLLGLSLEAVSRALSWLERSRIIAFEGRRDVRVLDRMRFEKIDAAL